MKRHMMHPYTTHRSDTQRQEHEEEGETLRPNRGGASPAAGAGDAASDGNLADQADAAHDVVEPAVENKAVPQEETPPPDDDVAARCKAEMEELRLRTAAEMENFKKRLAREHQEQMRFAAEKVLGDLLPSLDNLELALQYGSKHEACKDMLQGVAMTQKLLLDALTKNGLTALGEVGDEFSPEVHEAVGFEANPDLAPGSVTRVMQRGYKLNDRLLRAAKVMINQ